MKSIDSELTNREILEKEQAAYGEYRKHASENIEYVYLEVSEILDNLLRLKPDSWLDAPATWEVKQIEGASNWLEKAETSWEKVMEECSKANISDLGDKITMAMPFPYRTH